MSSAPRIEGHIYRCSNMVSVVNHLRGIGKEQSLATLRVYLERGGDHDKVLIKDGKGDIP